MRQLEKEVGKIYLMELLSSEKNLGSLCEEC